MELEKNIVFQIIVLISEKLSTNWVNYINYLFYYIILCEFNIDVLL